MINSGIHEVLQITSCSFETCSAGNENLPLGHTHTHSTRGEHADILFDLCWFSWLLMYLTSKTQSPAKTLKRPFSTQTDTVVSPASLSRSRYIVFVSPPHSEDLFEDVFVFIFTQQPQHRLFESLHRLQNRLVTLTEGSNTL